MLGYPDIGAEIIRFLKLGKFGKTPQTALTGGFELAFAATCKWVI